MKASNDPQFNRYYELHCKHLKLKGLQPKTIDAYTRALRRIGDYFDFQVDNLSQNQLLDYFHALLERLSWSAVKLDLYGLKFFYTHVLNSLAYTPYIQMRSCLTFIPIRQIIPGDTFLNYRYFPNDSSVS